MTVTDSNDSVHYTDMEYKSTLDTIRKKLIDTHGGYLRVRYTDSGRLLDYLSDFDTGSVQSVEFQPGPYGTCYGADPAGGEDVCGLPVPASRDQQALSVYQQNQRLPEPFRQHHHHRGQRRHINVYLYKPGQNITAMELY